MSTRSGRLKFDYAYVSLCVKHKSIQYKLIDDGIPKERGSTRTGWTEYLTGSSWLIKNLFEPFTCLHGVPGNIDHTFSFFVLDYVGVPKREIVSMDLLQTRKKE